MKRILSISISILFAITLLITTGCGNSGQDLDENILGEDDLAAELDDLPNDDVDKDAKADDDIYSDYDDWSVEDLEDESDDIHDQLVDLDDSVAGGQIDSDLYEKLKDSLEAKLDYISNLIDSKIKKELIVDPHKFREMDKMNTLKIDPGYIDPSPIEIHEAEVNEVVIVYDGVEGHPSQHYEVVNSIEDMDEHDTMSSPIVTTDLQEDPVAFEAKVSFN